MISVPISFECAETHDHYLPRPPDPRWEEAKRIAETINRTKVQDGRTGQGIYDHLVDSLIDNTLAIAKQRDHAPEPKDWTPPQRCVWRSANKVPSDRRWEIVHDKTVEPAVKAFVSVRQSRWLVLCPFPGCNGAQMASYTARKFFCVDCLNRAVGGKWVEVLWPEDPLAVEEWLSHRPHDAKNWDFGEGPEEIAEQDAKHGVGKGALSNTEENSAA